MSPKIKTTATSIAALFALSALSSQSFAGGPVTARFDPGSNQGPPSCGDEGLTPGAVLGGTANIRAMQDTTVDSSTVAGGPTEINGVVATLAAGPELSYVRILVMG